LVLKEKNRLEYVFDLRNLKGYTLILEPDIPAQQETMTVAGVQVSSPAAFNIAKDAEQLVIVVEISGYVYPYVLKELEYGHFSKEPIIEDFQLQGSSFTIDLWGKSDVTIFLHTDCNLQCIEGTIQRNGELTTLALKFNQQWNKKTITCKINRK
jgi:hypothetical protein